MILDDQGSLANKVLSELDSGGKISNIMSQVGSAGMEEDAVRKSLLYSGIVLGAEQTQQHFINHSNQMVETLRSTLTKLDAIVVHVSDIYAIEKIGELRHVFASALAHRARVLQDTFVLHAQSALGVPREYLEGPEPNDPIELQTIGLAVYARLPEYAGAWNYFTMTGKLSALPCRCGDCMARALEAEPNKDKDDYGLLDAARGAGSLATVLQSFASFVLAEHTARLEDLLSGAAPFHENAASTANEDLAGLLNRMRGSI